MRLFPKTTALILKYPKQTAAAIAVYLFLKIFGPSKNLFLKKNPLFSRLGRILLCIPSVREEYKKPMNKQLQDDRQHIKEHWKSFGDIHTTIPEEGFGLGHLTTLIDNLCVATDSTCRGQYMSGSIYSFSYWKPTKRFSEVINEHNEKDLADFKIELNNPEDFERLTMRLKHVYTYAFERSYLWNSLHQKEFGVGDWLSYQVVRMVADMYGGKADECMGFVTSGGTESLMTAVRCYRDWGIVNRHHKAGQGVILCSDSVHAGVNKGCEAYNVRCELIPVKDEHGTYDLAALQRAVYRHGNNLIAIVGSTPAYSLGVIDDIKALANIASKAGVGLHVDSCLGGFIVNFLPHINSNFLAIPGVTSLSCDTHKNGWAPKGSSVFITKKINDNVYDNVNLSYYAYYAIPGWDGGVYGTPCNPGSQHVTHVLHCYLAMLTIGKSGYRQLANSIHNTVLDMADTIDGEPRLTLLGNHPCNVIGWEINKNLNWGKGAIYAFAHEMEVRGVTVSALKGDRCHFCVTGRSAGDPGFMKSWSKALLESLNQTEQYAKQVKEGKTNFPGDAGLYGTLEAAMEPSKDNTKGFGDYIQNIIFGNSGAVDAVKSHFYALSDPYRTDLF